MDDQDIQAITAFAEMVKAACSSGRPISTIKIDWTDMIDGEDDSIRPNIVIEFSDVPVGDATV